jgi:hypothetical protein
MFVELDAIEEALHYAPKEKLLFWINAVTKCTKKHANSEGWFMEVCEVLYGPKVKE